MTAVKGAIVTALLHTWYIVYILRTLPLRPPRTWGARVMYYRYDDGGGGLCE